MKKKALLAFGMALLLGCPPGGGQSSSGVRSRGDFQKPGCLGESGPSAKELDRQKQELYQIIEDSPAYKTKEAKEQALEAYKRAIATKEETVCPREVERHIESIASLHKEE